MASPQSQADGGAQKDSPNWEKVKEEAEAKKAAAEAAKAQAEAEIAALKAQVGDISASGYTGGVTLEDKAGAIEAALLAAKAMNTAAQRIEERLAKNATGRTILLYSLSEVPDFQALMAYRAQIALVKKGFREAQAASSLAGPTAPPTPEAELEGVPLLPAAGLALDAVDKLLGFFRTDYSVGGIDLSLDDSMLIHALAGLIADPDQSREVKLPAVYNPGALSGAGAAILAELTSLSQAKVGGQEKAELHVESAARFTEQAGNEADTYKKAALLKQAEAHKVAAEAWKAAIGFFDGFFSKLDAADDKGTIPLAEVIRENEVFTALQGGDLLLIVKLQKSGGAYYTKKNMWSFFGGMPFYYMGGTVVSFVLLDGAEGSVRASGVVPVHGGFVKAGKLQAELESN